MTAYPLLDHLQIAARIPHAGRMCLLDAVTFWDAQRIVCSSASHRAPHHPLCAADGSLGVAAGIEYAAQALAVHGSLLAQRDGGVAGSKPPAGLLASVRNVEMHVSRLDTLTHDLRIEATQVAVDAHMLVYSFALYHDHPAEANAAAPHDPPRSNGLLLSGRASVVLSAHAA